MEKLQVILKLVKRFRSLILLMRCVWSAFVPKVPIKFSHLVDLHTPKGPSWLRAE